jgi:beta-galactosidase
MKQQLLAACMALFALTLSAQNVGRTTLNFNPDWKFHLGDIKDAYRSSYQDRDWRKLSVPHDWSIEGSNLQNAPTGGSGGYFTTGVGWYRKVFDLPGWSDTRQARIEFDGVFENAEVWLNEHYLGRRPYGYASFAYDLTPYLKTQGNTLAVRVDNSHQPNSRWYTGSGIYRHVRLVLTGHLHISQWGVFGYTKQLSADSALLHLEAEVHNEEKADTAIFRIKHVLRNADGVEVAAIQSEPQRVAAGDRLIVTQEMTVSKPQAWDLDRPYLYTLTTYLYKGNAETDRDEQSFGIRTIDYPTDRGFLLNGRQVKMKGVNLHHDAGAVGTAVPLRVWERRLEILKESGCNAIRTAHNAPAPQFLDLCDRMGFLVMDEAFDEWLHGKVTYGYHAYFKEWFEQDLTAMVKRDRNHPSVVMWSIGNEVPDQSSAEGPILAHIMIDLCHRLDPTRPVTSGNDNLAAGRGAATESFLAQFRNDIVGYNRPDRYGRPHKLLMALPSRLVDTEQRWKYTLLYDQVIGDFVWTGIDYYGETSWPSRGTNSGYLDNCGFKKDDFYFFQSIWTDRPVLHLAGHWNHPEQAGRIVPVICYTNCEEVELFVNGRSYGKKRFDATADLHLTWDVAYEPGEVKLVGRRDGQEHVYTCLTTGTATQLRLTVDRNRIAVDPDDVAHAIVEVVDNDGNVVPTAQNLITFDAFGADIIGVESGNMSDLSSPKSTTRKAYGGKCMAIIRAKQAGAFTITASSEGLQEAKASVTAIEQ